MKICYAQKDPQMKICAASLLCAEIPPNKSVRYAQSDPMLVCVATPTGMTLLSA